MSGIQGLMQAPGQGQPPQAPGQAAPPGQGQPPMPGMQPGAGGPQAGISSDRIPDLAKLNEQMLVQLFNLSMMGQIPNPSPISVLAAISEKQKQKQAIAAVQGAMAQGQNAQNQQSGTIAQQIIAPLMQGAQQQPTQMARHGGVMHGYADGGAVAFEFGGAAQTFPVIDQREVERILKKGPAARTPDENEYLRIAGIKLTQRQTQAPDAPPSRSFFENVKGFFTNPSDVAAAETRRQAIQATREFQPEDFTRGFTGTVPPPIEDARRRDDIPPEGMVVAQPAPRADATTKQGPPAVRPPGAAPQRPPAATSPFAGLASLVPKPDPELEAAFKSARDAAGPTAEQTRLLEEKQAAEMEGRRAAETGRSKRAEDERARATRAYEEALSGQQGIFGPRGLLEIAAAIDPRRGQIMGSLARGAAGVMAREEKAKKEAKTEYDRAQQLYSQELNALDAIKLATLERDTAIAKGRVDEARAAEARRAQLQIDYNKLKDERFRAQQKFELDRAQAEATAAYQQRVAGASERQATAAETTAKKPTEFDKKLDLLKNEPATYRRMFGDEETEKMLRLRATMAKDYAANALQLQTQGINSFEDYVRVVGPSLNAPAAANTGADFVFNPATGKLEPKK